MTTIRTRPYLTTVPPSPGRAATMPPITGPGRPGRASRTRLRLAVAAPGGLLAAGMITPCGRGTVTRRVSGRGLAIGTTGTVPVRIGQPKHRSDPAATPWRVRRTRQPRPTARGLDTRRHSPTQPAPRPVSAAEQVRADLVLSRFTRRHLSIYPVWSTTMPADTRSPQSRPHGASACCLARPAGLRVSAVGCRPRQRLTHRAGKSWS
jgi:hypothetical protein